MTNSSPLTKNAFKARALLIGERMNLEGWLTADNLASNPITVEVKGGGAATLHRYEVVVFFDVSPADEMAFLSCRSATLGGESLRYAGNGGSGNPYRAERWGERGHHRVAYLENAAPPRLQVIADILSKSALLSL